MSVGPEYFAALNPNFLLQIATSLLTYAPQQVSHSPLSLKGVRRIFVRGSMPSCCLRLKNFEKSDYEMVHSEVNLKKYVVSIALFCMFSLLNFLSILLGGHVTPFAPVCGRPCCLFCPVFRFLISALYILFACLYIVCFPIYLFSSLFS